MKRLFSFLMAVVLGITSAFATTVYCKMTYSWWTTADAAVAVHYWGGASAGTTWPGVRMAAVSGETGMWSYDVPADVTGLMFVRVNGGSDAVSDWGAKTANLALQTDGKNLYTITSTSAVWGDPGVTGEWSKYETSGGDDPDPDPEPETPVDSTTVYFYNSLDWTAVNTFVWPKSGDAYKGWPGEAAKMQAEQINNVDVYAYTFPASFANVIFNNGSDQTADLKWDADKPYFVPGSKDGDGKYTGTWYAKEEIPAEEIPAPVKYYIIGSGAFGEWSFVPVYKDTFEIKDLAAGNHMFRIALVNESYEQKDCKGFSDLTETPAGVTRNNDNNILFTYTEAGDFKVVYNSTEFKVFGNFYVKPVVLKELNLVPGVWAEANAKIAAWIWGAELDGQWTSFFTGSDTLKAEINADADSIEFVRFNATADAPTWENEETNVWNKLAGDTIDYEDLTYTITDWDAGTWDVYVPVVPAKFYVTGDSAFVIDAGLTIAKKWAPDAIKSTEDVLVIKNLKAGVAYQITLTEDGTWSTKKTYENLTSKPLGLIDAAGDDHNIGFTLENAGDVTVTYKVIDEKTTFTVEGDFAMPSVAFAGNVTKWAQVPMTIAKDKKSASVTLEKLTAGVDSFKIVLGGKWISANGEGETCYTFHRGWKADANIKGGDRNMLLNRDKAGDYTFTWVYANDSLHIDFPELIQSTLTIAELEHGSITVKKKVGSEQVPVESGSKVDELTELTISASPADGYEISNLRAFETDSEKPVAIDSEDKLIMPAVAVTITANVEKAAKFYITGDSALVVDAGFDKKIAWNPAAIKVTEDSKVLSLLAGTYQLKVTLDGTWGDGKVKGFDELTTKTVGLKRGTGDDENNIIFTLEKAGDVTITYTDKVFTVEGKFKKPEVKLYGEWEKDGDEKWVGHTMVESGDIATYATALEKGEYEFVIVNNGIAVTKVNRDKITEEYVPYGLHREWQGVAGVTGDAFTTNNLKVYVDKAGVHTFTWIYENDSIHVDFPEFVKPAVTLSVPEHGEIIVKNDKDTIKSGTKIVEGTKLYVKAESKSYDYILTSLHAYKGDNVNDTVHIVNDTLVMPDAELHIVATLGFHEAKIAGLDGTWDGKLLETAKDGKSASVKLNLPFGPKTFKMVIDGNWLGEGEAFTRKATAHKMTSLNSETNATLNVDIKGDYTFTWNFADSTLTVGYPAAPDTVDIFFVNTFKDWNDGVYAYIYEDAIGVKEWPGVKMTKDEKQVQGKDLYKVTALTSYSKIVFNNGKTEGEVVGVDQTDDLLWESTHPVYCDGKWYADTASVDEIEPATYYLAGNAPLVEHFGMASSSAWTSRIKAIKDTFLIENLEVGFYKMKVVTKDQEPKWIGFDKLTETPKGLRTDGAKNICFTMTKQGDVTVVYKVQGTDTTLVVKGDFETFTVVSLADVANKWDETVDLFTVSKDSLTATLIKHLDAGIDSLKIVSDGNWLSLNGDGEECFYIHRMFPQTGSLKNVEDLRNLVINADVAGDYTFTWTYADSTLAITYPALPKDDNQYAVAGDCLALFYHRWRAYHDYGYTDLKQQADGMFKWERKKVKLPAGNVELKISKNKSFTPSWPEENYVLAIPENGEYTVTILFNAVTHDIFATATKTGNAKFHDPIDLAGSWDEFTKDHRCIIDEENLKALITMNLKAGDYQFKFHNNDLWFGNGQEFSRENASIYNIDEGNNKANMVLHADVDGDYIFTWIFENNHAMIQFPSLVPTQKISRLTGEFSVSETKKVNFSRGNLQYNFGKNEWYTAEKQYEVLGDANLRLGDETYKGSVDLFSWSCESSNYGLLASNTDADFTGDFIDWGELFAGEEDTWRTLSLTEFTHLLERKKDGHVLWTCVALGPDSVIGLALFPDDWTVPNGLTVAKYGFAKNDDAAALKKTNYYSFEQWEQMEAAGAVVLPAGGSRAGAWGNYVTDGVHLEPDIVNPLTGSYCWVSYTYNTGYYWLGEDPNFFIYGENAWGNTVASGPRERRRGHNVRLVTEVPDHGGETGLDEIGNAEKAVKVIVNDQLLIIKNGKIYNGQGQLIR